MTSHRDKLEAAIMFAYGQLVPEWTPEARREALQYFQRWRILNEDNRLMVARLEERAETQGAEWRDGVRWVATEFHKWRAGQQSA